MNKFKVFLSNGTIQTIPANGFNIEWDQNRPSTLRLYIDDKMIALFPSGGWLGMQSIEPPKKEIV